MYVCLEYVFKFLKCWNILRKKRFRISRRYWINASCGMIATIYYTIFNPLVTSDSSNNGCMVICFNLLATNSNEGIFVIIYWEKIRLWYCMYSGIFSITYIAKDIAMHVTRYIVRIMLLISWICFLMFRYLLYLSLYEMIKCI